FPEQSESSLIDNNGQLANLITEMRALKRATTSVALETNALHPLFDNAHVKLNELEQDALLIAELDESPHEMAAAFVELSIKYLYLSDAVYSLITESGVKMHLRLNETLNLLPRVDKDQHQPSVESWKIQLVSNLKEWGKDASQFFNNYSYETLMVGLASTLLAAHLDLAREAELYNLRQLQNRMARVSGVSVVEDRTDLNTEDSILELTRLKLQQEYDNQSSVEDDGT